MSGSPSKSAHAVAFAGGHRVEGVRGQGIEVHDGERDAGAVDEQLLPEPPVAHTRIVPQGVDLNAPVLPSGLDVCGAGRS